MSSIPSLSSKKSRNFLKLLSQKSKNYLEIGCYLGGTAVSVLENNSLNAYFVDNWKDNVSSFKDVEYPENNKSIFIENIKKVKGNNNIKVFDCDMFNVDISEIKNIDLFFYDADHSFEMTQKIIKYYYPTFDKECILVIDDANFDGVVYGTKSALDELDCEIIYERIILTENLEDENDLWNGFYICVIKK